MDALGRRDETVSGRGATWASSDGVTTRRAKRRTAPPLRCREVAKQESGGSALERARGADEGGLSGAATRLLERLLDVGIDGKGPFDSAHTVADQALKNAGGDPDQAIRMVHRQHRRLGLAAGFATGFGGFFTMAIALPANVLEFYLLGTRMTAATARLRGYDIDQPEIRSAVLLTLAGADSDDLLKKAGSSRPAANSRLSRSNGSRRRRSWCSTRRSPSVCSDASARGSSRSSVVHCRSSAGSSAAASTPTC